MVLQWYYNCQGLIDDDITMVLQWYYNCQGLINNGITMVLQLPAIN